jgi:4-hydroxybenzoate polyprenyltransferase
MPDPLPAAVPSGTIWRAAVEACFYGHLFYGVCAVAQVIETSVQLALPANGWLMAGAFLSTVIFYSYPYSRRTATSADPRVAWHQRHRDLVERWQLGGLLILIALLAWMVIRHRTAIRTMSPQEWFFLLVFPYVGGLYYGAPVMWPSPKLRHSGWLKPFVIGFVWAGVVVAYPILFARVQYGRETQLELFPVLLFVKTLMFVAVLAMLFDIKDREADQRVGLSTVVTLVGLERTIFHISIPLTVLGVVTFLSYASVHHLTLARVLLVLAPFGLLVAGIVSLRQPRSILYYLTVVDGLMLAKAVLDILAFQF